MSVAAGAVACALALDVAVAEPPARVHPVAWLGRCIAPFDRDWGRPRAVGLGVAVAVPLAAAAVAAGAVFAASQVGAVAAAVAAGLALFSSTSLRMLLDTADDVVGLTATDLGAARSALRALAGRDAAALSPAQVRSAAVESAAENLADGLVGPLLAFGVCAPFSLPLAAGAAAWVKAVNTLDSMLGYRSKPVGWASARLDDAVMWLPARVSAVLLAVAGRAPGALVDAAAWARAPPSPNSGWPMATLAAALGVRLEKPDVYVLNAAAPFPDAAAAARGVRVVGVAGLLAYLCAGVVAWI